MLLPLARRFHALAPSAAKVAGVGLPILVLAFFLAWEVPRVSPITYRQTDILPIFLGLQALAAGHDPYSLSVGAEAYRQTAGHAVGLTIDRAAQFGFHYPLPPAFLYLPFSFFPSLELAILIIRTLTAAVYLAALFCLLQRYASTSSLPVKAGILLWGLAWWPFLAVILPVVQPTGIVLAALAFCLLALDARRWFWAGFALFFALLKPQDALPAAAVLLIYGLFRAEARWRLLAGFAVAGLVPTVAAFLWRPDWLVSWLEMVRDLPPHIPGYYQNPPEELASTLGPAGIIVWLIAGVLLLAWVVVVTLGARANGQMARLRIGQPHWALALGCALMVALAPRTGLYEMTIGLIPWFYAWDWAGEIQRRWLRRAALSLLAGGWFACGLLVYLQHGRESSVAFGAGLVIVLGLLSANSLRSALHAEAPAEQAPISTPREALEGMR